MRSMLVIGLGRFGGHLARKLSDLGNEVMVVDMDEEAVEKLAPHVTWAQVGLYGRRHAALPGSEQF